MTGTKTKSAAPARERILETAKRLFYRNGIRATGIDTIIAEARVAKMSFYNNFPSKDDLVRAFLVARHESWMAAFSGRVERHIEERGLAALAFALDEWFAEPDFRGCAFINTVAEFGQAFEGAMGHKVELEDYVRGIATRLGLSAPERVAGETMIVIEGAIVRAQMGFREGLRDQAASLLQLIERGARD
ncbi:TetR/AcrR family transcriptional regulator [Ciceribacter thiooxidans]|uniref:TetR/AcrR family transcriptional regulator n=1 Tax=Ciceribacter thiooxidans TaxID=1969821 RepID=A0ABV7HVH1_9HYPH|nr:TetR/AcrR family transcriptional regulator [Ciceribacter thiooxidans]